MPSVPRLLHHWFMSLALVVACGDDDVSPGTELGPCVQGQFCESPLQCVDDLCVNPDQLGESGGSMSGGSNMTTSPGESGGEGGSMTGATATSAATASGGDSGDSPVVYCGGDGDNACLCSHSADYGPPDAPCSADMLPPTAWCCPSEGWPAFGACSCWTYSCRTLDSGICYCGLGQPDAADQPVGSCTVPVFGGGSGGGGGGGVCCLDPGSGCTCYADLPQCPSEDEQQVGQCSVESIGCSDGVMPTSACN